MTNTALIPANAVFAKDGEAFTNSRIVAEVFGKEHRRVLQDIRHLIAPEEGMHGSVQTPSGAAAIAAMWEEVHPKGA